VSGRPLRILTPEAGEEPRQEQRNPEQYEARYDQADGEPEAALEIAELDVEHEGKQTDAAREGVAGTAPVDGYRKGDAGQHAAEDFEWEVAVLGRDEGGDDRHRRT